MEKQAENIEKIRGRFDNEWLLIAIDDSEARSDVPVSGSLLKHSPRKEEILEASNNYRGLAYIVYSEDWPKDLAACFIQLT